MTIKKTVVVNRSKRLTFPIFGLIACVGLVSRVSYSFLTSPGIPLQGSILTALFPESLNPVPLIRTLDHLAGRLMRFEAELFLPMSILSEPPILRAFEPRRWSSLRLFSSTALARKSKLCFRNSDVSGAIALRVISGLELVDVIISGMSVGFSNRVSIFFSSIRCSAILFRGDKSSSICRLLLRNNYVYHPLAVILLKICFYCGFHYQEF